MKVGIVDLDTSHAAAWIPIERELGADVVGIWDGGSVYDNAYVQRFAAEHGIGKVFRSLEAMAAEVDLAIIHGCNWDSHVKKAKFFVEADKALIIDKPIAGCLGDLHQLAEWAQHGARIYGGSSLRFAPELQAWKAIPVSERGSPHTVLSGCAVDEFNYGVHAYTLACSAMGPGVCQARWVGGGAQDRVELQWPDGRIAWVVVGQQTGGWMPFHLTIITELGVTQLLPDSALLYRAFLEAGWAWLSGSAEAPCSFEELIEPEFAALAALLSKKQGGHAVAICDLDIDVHFDGASFASKYRQQTLN